jgi:very-short-patch-repair endonuclease
MSGVEWDLWSSLRGRQLEGFKFRRKALIGPYIVDFACLSARLVVEVGGEMWDRSAPSDAARAAWLVANGFRVVRFTPVDVRERPEHVLDAIRAELAGQPRYLSVGFTPAGPSRGSFRGRRARPRRPAGRGP